MTTTADETALLHAIRTHPAEDTPRLAYADWLDENGGSSDPCKQCRGSGEASQHWDPASDTWRGGGPCYYCSGSGVVSDGRRERAEFVRVQISLSRFGLPLAGQPVVTGDREADAEESQLRQRERVLWREWSRRWFGWGTGTENFGSALTPNEVDPRVRRGFVAEVRMSAADFLDAAKGLFSVHPIERVVLTDREPEAYSYETFWRWFLAGELPRFVGDDPAVLPDAIWRLFHDHPPYSTSSIRRTLGWEFASRDEALAALSAACVAYGRGLVGLPT